VARVELRPVEEDGKAGVQALRGGEAVGRLVATLGESEVRGRHAWSALGDEWLAPGEDAALFRVLYAAAAPSWVEAGYLDHYVVVPADESLLAVWYSLSFAQQQVHAALALRPIPAPEPDGFAVRLGGSEDLDVAMELAFVIYDHQAGTPTYAGVPAPSEDEARVSYAEYLAEPGVTYFVAERDGKPLGHLILERQSDSETELTIAATAPEARGLGVGSALTDLALGWAHDQGFETVVTDWRSANLLAASFWIGRGFEPTAYRLFRRIEPTAR
jgi:ribosomal protein S18 acetylase RimI-like enzyme